MAKKKREPIRMTPEELKYHRDKFKLEMELRSIWRKEKEEQEKMDSKEPLNK